MSLQDFNQTLRDVSARLPLNGIRAKDLSVTLGRTHIKVATKSGEVLIDGDLYAPTHGEENTWSVVDGVLEVTLEKINQEWWPHVLTTDEKIDVTKLAPENSSLSELDPQTRAQVEKMMYDQRQKQMGLPTSEDQRKQKMLEEFKKQHPELDFSHLKDDAINFK